MLPNYRKDHIAKASFWLVKAADTFEEANELNKSGQTRLGVYNRLYYTVHHVATALLNLLGFSLGSHKKIRNQFGLKWVKERGFPPSYGKLLKSLYKMREDADYGEYISTELKETNKLFRIVRFMIKRAKKELPPFSIAKILAIICSKEKGIRDFSFDVYCPKSYFHHTRFTLWLPKGRVDDRLLNKLETQARTLLAGLGISDNEDYVIGLNSRVNQYEDNHIIMLDVDDKATFEREKIANEPGYLFRTQAGFHFFGSVLYTYKEWKKKMKKYIKMSSDAHCKLSFMRGYATLRISTSPRKPYQPVFIGQIKDETG